MTAGTVTGAAYTWLAAQPDVAPLLGSSPLFPVWIFQERVYGVVEGSQSCAIVLTQESGWTAPNDFNSAEFPRLGVEIWADPRRDASNRVVFDDTSDKISAIVRVLNKYLHSLDGHEAWWGDLLVINSTRLNEPAFSPVVDGDHARTAMLYYALTLGGWV